MTAATLELVPELGEDQLDWKDAISRSLGYAERANRQVLDAARAIADAVGRSGKKWKKIKEELGEFAVIEAKNATALAAGFDAIAECERDLLKLPTAVAVKLAKLALKNPDAARAIVSRAAEFSAQEISKMCTAGKRMPDICDPAVLLGGVCDGALVHWTDERVVKLGFGEEAATVMATVVGSPTPNRNVKLAYFSKYSKDGQNGTHATAWARLSDVRLVPYKLEGRADELADGACEYLGIRYGEPQQVEAIAEDIRKRRRFVTAPEIEYELRANLELKPVLSKSETLAELARRAEARGAVIKETITELNKKIFRPSRTINQNFIRRALAGFMVYGCESKIGVLPPQRHQAVQAAYEDATDIENFRQHGEHWRIEEADLVERWIAGNGTYGDSKVTLPEMILYSTAEAMMRIYFTFGMEKCGDMFDAPYDVLQELYAERMDLLDSDPSIGRTSYWLQDMGLYGKDWANRNPMRAVAAGYLNKLKDFDPDELLGTALECFHPDKGLF